MPEPVLQHDARYAALLFRFLPLMILLFVILAVVIVAALVFADYKWRRWMAARKREHEGERS